MMLVTICNYLVVNMIFVFSKKKKSILSGIMTIVMVFTMCFAFFSTPAAAVSKAQITALQQQQTALAKKKADIQAQASAINSKVSAQTEKLELLSQQLDVTNSELQNLTQQIAFYTNSIAEMENELVLDEQKEAELLAEYKVRMRAMEENGSSTYISIVLGASNFQDLLGRIECVKEIMEHDDNLINDVRAAQVKVKQQKADTEAEVAAEQIAFASYQDKQADLVNQQAEVKTVLASLQANSADYNKQLETVKALQSTISGQITSMKSELAEQQRLQAEQNAAKQTTPSNNSTWYGETTGTGTGQDIVNYAKNFLGVNYVYGGTSPSGFDCSGLVYYCYRHFGYSVNRTAASLAYSGKAVSSSDLKVGDIILFTSTDGGYVGHTGIYIGGGQFIHAPHTGDVVKISSLSDSYYTAHYWGARRVIS
jgi:peptidoglycan DL-endopeptidase CwlO